jgi:hypothetical protein
VSGALGRLVTAGGTSTAFFTVAHALSRSVALPSARLTIETPFASADLALFTVAVAFLAGFVASALSHCLTRGFAYGDRTTCHTRHLSSRSAGDCVCRRWRVKRKRGICFVRRSHSQPGRCEQKHTCQDSSTHDPSFRNHIHSFLSPPSKAERSSVRKTSVRITREAHMSFG